MKGKILPLITGALVGGSIFYVLAVNLFLYSNSKEAMPVRATDVHAGQICVEGRLYNVVKQPGGDYFSLNQAFTINQQGIAAIPCEEEKTDD